MALRFWLQQPGGTLLDISGRCQKWKVDIGEKAEEGAADVSTVVIEDPDGDLELYGHRVFAIEETEAIDPDNRFIAVGYLGMERQRRGTFRTGASRIHVVEVSDPNTIFERRTMTGGDNDRPDETDVERIQWLVDTNEAEAIDDTRYLSTADPEDMDEADYNLQQASAVYSDCANQTGKNWYLTYFGDVGVTAETPWGSLSLWYGDPASDDYLSSATLTNIEAEVDIDNGNFYIGVEDGNELIVDPMRIYSKVIVPYAKGYVSASNDETRDTYGRRDKVMPAENVKRAATATRRAKRYVRDLKTPEHRATVKTVVPRRFVNLIRPGMGVPVKVSHWSGYQDEYLTMRVMSRRVVEISDDPQASFELTLELSRSVPGPPAPPLYGILYVGFGPRQTEYGTDILYFANPGDTPGPGFEYRPTTGLITPMQDATPPGGNGSWYAWRVDGDGELDLVFFTNVIGVIIPPGIDITYSVNLNGTPVESVTHSEAAEGLEGHGDSATITITGLAVSNGDLITAHVSFSPAGHYAFGRSPAGTGQNGQRLEITGGTVS